MQSVGQRVDVLAQLDQALPHLAGGVRRRNPGGPQLTPTDVDGQAGQALRDVVVQLARQS